jgi:hypothetical protein
MSATSEEGRRDRRRRANDPPFWAARLGLALAVLGMLASPARANCPGGSPCETINVYRIQTWPGFRTDANGVDLLSLQEANAANLGAFKPVIKAYTTNGGLALRFSVTRIADAPNGYCNCNFEYQNKACRPPISNNDLKMCVRSCLNSGAQCRFAGVDAKSEGSWYAFPALTEKTAAKATWQKNAFKISPQNGDWSAAAPSIKRAKCIADAFKANPQVDIDGLFNTDNPCPTVDAQTSAHEAIPR